MKQIKIGVGFGLWRLGMPSAETIAKVADDVIARIGEYVAAGLDKFVLWPIADPDSWARQVEMAGREIASHYARAV